MTATSQHTHNLFAMVNNKYVDWEGGKGGYGQMQVWTQTQT